jgi:hypothetical protein
MLAYALFLAFAGAFIAIVATGHVLLLMAFYPELFGKLDARAKNNGAPAGPKPGRSAQPPQAPELAA